MLQIRRLRIMAREALEEYQSALKAGSEPAFPQWAEDMLQVCDLAEASAPFHGRADSRFAHPPPVAPASPECCGRRSA